MDVSVSRRRLVSVRCSVRSGYLEGRFIPGLRFVPGGAIWRSQRSSSHVGQRVNLIQHTKVNK